MLTFKNKRGFTLLELLITMSILTVVVTLVFSVFHIGAKIWEKSETQLTARQRTRIIPEIIKTQLASPSVPELYALEKNSLLIGGTEKLLTYFSTVSVFPESLAGNFYLQYRVEKYDQDGLQSLLFYEQDVNQLDGTSIPDIEKSQFLELLSGYWNISFSYKYDREDFEIEQWHRDWTPGEQFMIPQAIELLLQKDESDTPTRLIIPVFLKP